MIIKTWNLNSFDQLQPMMLYKPQQMQARDIPILCSPTQHNYVVRPTYQGIPYTLITCYLSFCRRYIAVIMDLSMNMFQIQINGPECLFRKGSIFMGSLNSSSKDKAPTWVSEDVVLCAGITTHKLSFTIRHKYLMMYCSNINPLTCMRSKDTKKLCLSMASWRNTKNITTLLQQFPSADGLHFLCSNDNMHCHTRHHQLQWSRQRTICVHICPHPPNPDMQSQPFTPYTLSINDDSGILQPLQTICQHIQLEDEIVAKEPCVIECTVQNYTPEIQLRLLFKRWRYDLSHPSSAPDVVKILNCPRIDIATLQNIQQQPL